MLQVTKRLAQRLGTQIVWPVDKEFPWWELPHLGWLKAHRLGVAERFYHAVTTARWTRGENICDQAVLRRICASEGLDAEAIVGAVHDPEIRAAGVECLVDAYQ